MVDRYRARMSGPLLDRIDLQVQVPPVKLAELRADAPAESSASMRDRVMLARERQQARLAEYGLRCNAEMTTTVLRACCPLDDACENKLAELVLKREGMSARSINRLIKVARTIADLLGVPSIDPGCLDEASGYRAVDPTADVIVGDLPSLAAPPRPGFATAHFERSVS
jgi:magnesium chelatase family protein